VSNTDQSYHMYKPGYGWNFRRTSTTSLLPKSTMSLTASFSYCSRPLRPSGLEGLSLRLDMIFKS
jgi:hypothetical protein